MLWRVVISGWVVALLCFASAPALAQTDTDLAKQHYKLGAEMHKRADFKGALQHFRKSFELSRRAALLYNIGKCHESLGEHQKAIDYFKQYLLSKPRDIAHGAAKICVSFIQKDTSSTMSAKIGCSATGTAGWAFKTVDSHTMSASTEGYPTRLRIDSKGKAHLVYQTNVKSVGELKYVKTTLP